MRIGFIGIGYMGKHMARNIAEGGHELTVFDINREAADEIVSEGATWAESPRSVAMASEAVFTSLPGPREVEEVLTGERGALSGMREGTAYFDLSTIDPATIHRIDNAARSIGVDVLDAPVSGGTVGAEEATLCVMVGGNQEVYERYEPVLDLIGDKTMYCGPLGSGAICKIVNNLVGSSVAVVLAEAFTLGIKAGVDPTTLFEAVSKSSGNTARMETFPDGLFKGDFEPGFQVDLASKDVGLATELGRDLELPMDLSNLVHQRYIEAQHKGWGKLESSAVIRLQEERSGVEIRT